jgi:hypothetical protein
MLEQTAEIAFWNGRCVSGYTDAEAEQDQDPRISSFF